LTASELKQRIHNAEVDVNYAQYYPLSKVYSSLYPKMKQSKKKAETSTDEDEASNQQADEVDGPKGDVETWKAIERRSPTCATTKGGEEEDKEVEGEKGAGSTT